MLFLAVMPSLARAHDDYIVVFSRYAGDSLVTINDSLDAKLYKVIASMEDKAKRKVDISITMIPYSEETYNKSREEKLLSSLTAKLKEIGVKPGNIHTKILAYSSFNDGMCRDYNNSADVCIHYLIYYKLD